MFFFLIVGPTNSLGLISNGVISISIFELNISCEFIDELMWLVMSIIINYISYWVENILYILQFYKIENLLSLYDLTCNKLLDPNYYDKDKERTHWKYNIIPTKVLGVRSTSPIICLNPNNLEIQNSHNIPFLRFTNDKCFVYFVPTKHCEYGIWIDHYSLVQDINSHN